MDRYGHGVLLNRVYSLDRRSLPLLYLDINATYQQMLADNRTIKAYRFLEYSYNLMLDQYIYYVTQ